MIAEDLLHPALFLLILIAAGTHAIMDSIKDYRTQIAMHPYRDFWHLVQIIRMLAILDIGRIWGACLEWDQAQTYLVAALALICANFLWDALYKMPWTWFRLDTMIQCSTGWKWLDKRLGFHW
jgi:hypothetical protein